MKNKVLAVLTAAMVGVVTFVPMMTAMADYYEAPCYKCGESSIVAEVIGHRYEQITPDNEPESCRHGHALAADFLFQYQDLVRYYCGDCQVHWEDWENAGICWYCTFDDAYHF